jgi:hypothetical protein
MQMHCRDGIVIMDRFFIEISADIYESARLGLQGNPGYIWQSTIRTSKQPNIL